MSPLSTISQLTRGFWVSWTQAPLVFKARCVGGLSGAGWGADVGFKPFASQGEVWGLSSLLIVNPTHGAETHREPGSQPFLPALM